MNQLYARWNHPADKFGLIPTTEALTEAIERSRPALRR